MIRAKDLAAFLFAGACAAAVLCAIANPGIWPAFKVAFWPLLLAAILYAGSRFGVRA